MNTLASENTYQRILHALKSKNFSKAEQISMFSIKEKPRDAQLWAYLGFALSEQGYGSSAKKCYERAQLLDPQADWIENAIRTVKGNRQKKSVGQILQVNAVTVSAGILVKDEERSIERCITSLLGAVDEIVVIDTGSTDRTIEIVKKFPNVKLLEFPWCDDFSAARNYGLQFMTSNWVIWVDADEYLHSDDKDAVRQIAALYNDCNVPAILKIGIINHGTNSVQISYEPSRMFSLQRGLRYWGRIHEQISSTENNFFKGSFIRPTVRIRLHHDGYHPSVMEAKNKLQRNIKLLQRMVEEDPNNPTWFYFLGRELFLLDKTSNQAIEMLCKAEKLAANIKYFASNLSLLTYLILAYMESDDFKKAEDACKRALALDPNYPDAWYFLAQIKLSKAKILYQQAEENAIRSKEWFQNYRNVVSADHDIHAWKADSALADIALLSGNLIKAKQLYSKVLSKKSDLETARTHLQYIETVSTELNKP